MTKSIASDNDNQYLLGSDCADKQLTTVQTAQADRVQKHQQFIVDNILTAHCPNSRCLAVVKFETDFLMHKTCSRCKIDFFAWCSTSPTIGAVLVHVYNCPRSLKSGLTGTLNLFNECHRGKRTADITRYVYSDRVFLEDRAALINAMRSDLDALGINTIDQTNSDTAIGSKSESSSFSKSSVTQSAAQHSESSSRTTVAVEKLLAVAKHSTETIIAENGENVENKMDIKVSIDRPAQESALLAAVKKKQLDRVYVHRLYIIDQILTVHCPHVKCKRSCANSILKLNHAYQCVLHMSSVKWISVAVV